MVGSEGSISADEFGYEATPARKYTIAVVVKSAAIPVWESHIVAAKKAGSELGVEILDYSPSKADNVEEQKRILEDLITTGVDAVILAPANTEAVKGPVQDLIDAGIPVIYDNTMGPSDVDYLTYVGVDNAEVGRMIAEEMAAKIDYKGMNSFELCDYILEKANVLVAPGDVFGEGGEKCIRIAYPASMETLEKTAERFKQIFM